MVQTRSFWAFLCIAFTAFTGCQTFQPAQPVISDQEPFTKQIQVPTNVSIIQLNQHVGSVTVKGWDKSYILLEGFKSATAKDVETVRAILDQIVFNAYETSDEVLVVEYEDPLQIAEYNPFDSSDRVVHLTVNLPRNLSLELFNDSGSVMVSDIDSGVLIDQKQGDIEASNIRAGLQIISNRANITVSNIERFLDIDSRRGQLDVRTINGDITISHNDGTVLVSETTGNVSLFCDQADCTLRQIQGSITADNSRGDLTMHQVFGGVEISLRNGTVRFQPRIPVPQNYSINVTIGDIVAHLHESSNMMLNLTAENGSIESDFPLPVSADRNMSNAKGTVNSGSHPVTMSVKRGRISVIKTSGSTTAGAEPATPPAQTSTVPASIESEDIQSVDINP